MGGRPLTALAIAAFPQGRAGPRHDSRDLPRRVRQAARGRRRAARRPYGPGPRDQVRLRGHRRDRSGSHADERRREARRRALPDEASGHRHHRHGVEVRPASIRRSPNAAIQSMRTLNRSGRRGSARLPNGSRHACTDVTGFGLAGHGSEMAAGSGVTLASAAGRCPGVRGRPRACVENRSGRRPVNQSISEAGVRHRIGGPVEPDVVAVRSPNLGRTRWSRAPDASPDPGGRA